MAIREIMGLDRSLPTAEPVTRTEPAFGRIITKRATKFLAILRVLLGVEFLWAFLDKTFGLGYATPAARAWIHGGSPTNLDSREAGLSRLCASRGCWVAERRGLRVDVEAPRMDSTDLAELDAR
jgi:hypothetical protein